MYYVQFFQKGIMTDNNIEILGDRGVFILDGRNNLETMTRDAKARNIYLKTLGYKPTKAQIIKSEYGFARGLKILKELTLN